MSHLHLLLLLLLLLAEETSLTIVLGDGQRGPSSVQVQCASGVPDATHLRETDERTCRANVCVR